MFNQPGVFYFNQPDTVYDKTDWSIDLEKIQKLKQHQLVVADFSSEHYGNDTLYNLYECLDSHKINFILLSHDIDDHQRRDKLFFYPHWYHWAKKRFVQTYNPNINNLEKKFNVSCLNANPRYHRIYNFLTLRKKPYFNDWFFSMHQTDSNPIRNDDYILPAEYVNEWKEICDTLPVREKLTINTRISSNTLNPAYTDSYINLVTEVTMLPKIFVSEKTWKPVASGQLFLVIGNPGIIGYLRSQGVDVFDDIIDHKYYDNETNWETRILKIHTVIESLLTKDLYKINEVTQARRLSNAKKFFAGEFNTQYSQDITTCINMLN
jgi:hypothetical protein